MTGSTSSYPRWHICADDLDDASGAVCLDYQRNWATMQVRHRLDQHRHDTIDAWTLYHVVTT